MFSHVLWVKGRPRRLRGRTDHEQPVVTESGLGATGAVMGCRLGTVPQTWPQLRRGSVPGSVGKFPEVTS